VVKRGWWWERLNVHSVGLRGDLEPTFGPQRAGKVLFHEGTRLSYPYSCVYTGLDGSTTTLIICCEQPQPT
jgi:hypothetical protein